LAEISTTYTSDYFKSQKLQAQISALESAIQQEQRDIVQQAQTRYLEALRREKLLNSRYDNQSSIVTNLGQRAIQYKMLEQEVEGNRQSYTEMLKQVKEATVSAAARTDNVRLVDEATPSKYPTTPKPPLNCALGFLVGSFSSFLYAFVRERTDSSFREPGEGLQYLGVAELGAVVRLRHAHISSPSFGTPLSGSRSNPFGVLESYRYIVTSLLSEPNAERARLLVVTSPGPNEGKTAVTANLGIMLSSIGRRVLLVEGDTRKQCLDKIFGLQNDRGLSTLLQASLVKTQNLRTFVQETSNPGLFVLTGGPLAFQSVNLLHSAVLRDVMAQMKHEYDFVLVDTPPVLPVADARIIGGLADGVIFVVRARRTTRGAAFAAYQRLGADGIPVIGMILNAWDPKSSAYPYYADYAREYSGSI
jgi:polysaccharide biosynthesis transport protein